MTATRKRKPSSGNYFAATPSRKKAKKAYRPSVKRRNQRARKPFVEGKVRIKSVISALMQGNQTTYAGKYPQPMLEWPIHIDPAEASGGNAYQIIPLEPFYRMTQGFQSFQMIGDSVYGKSLRLKVAVDFPYADEVIVRAFKMYVITGFITRPMAATATTTPTRSDVTVDDITSYINQQLFEYFDSKDDPLEFHEKRRQNLKIVSYKRLKPKVDGLTPITHAEQVAPGTTSKVAHGAPHSVQKNFTWKLNRKVHYELGAPAPTDSDTLPPAGDQMLQNWYPNDAWLPFAIFYMPEWEKMKNVAGSYTSELKFRHNVAFYYSDS